MSYDQLCALPPEILFEFIPYLTDSPLVLRNLLIFMSISYVPEKWKRMTKEWFHLYGTTYVQYTYCHLMKKSHTKICMFASGIIRIDQRYQNFFSRQLSHVSPLVIIDRDIANKMIEWERLTLTHIADHQEDHKIITCFELNAHIGFDRWMPSITM